jgi:hypothetical protein
MFYILVTIPATLCLIILVSGCTQLAPFAASNSAHTVGEGATAIQGGVTTNGRIPYGRIGCGVSKNLEIGLLMENHPYNLIGGPFAKYALLNNPEQGVSLSVEGGLGTGIISTYYGYIGPMIGYKKNRWDGYIGARYNYVHNDLYWDDEYGEDGYGYNDFGWGHIVKHHKSSLQYGVVTAGNTIWLTKKCGVNLNANYSFGAVKGTYGGVGLVYVFGGK